MMVKLPSKENYALLEGEWKNFVFRKIQPKDWEQVIQHVKDSFLHDEPSSKLLGYSDQYGAELEVMTRKILAEHLSFIAEDKITNELAAVQATFRHTQNSDFNDIELISKSGKMLFRLQEQMDKEANLLERFGIDEFADIFISSTAPKFRNQGLCTEMYARLLRFLEAEDFKLVKSMFSSPYSRAVVTKMNFETICSLHHVDFKDENGDQVFRVEDLTPEHFVAIMVKKLGDFANQ